ncbi:MAG TPA: hypothetical protein VKY40_03810 [Halanaerobiales bacterium]|nr:hypothetical protein [Halanaerobiales bacterium]
MGIRAPGFLLTTVTVPVHLNGVKNGLLVSTMKEEEFLPVYTGYDNFKIKGIVRE